MKWSARFIAVFLILLGVGLFIFFRDSSPSSISSSPPGRDKAFSWSVVSKPRVARRKIDRDRLNPFEPENGGTNLSEAVVLPDDKHVLKNEYVLSFFDDHDRKSFIDIASARGVEIIGLMDMGHSVRIRVRNKEQFDQLLADAPTPVDYGPNTRSYSPEGPWNKLQPPDTPYVAFSRQALEWLGISGDHSSWGKGITVAVIDTGVHSHASLTGNRITRIDLVNKETESDHDWHGTAVASLIAGNSEALKGVVPSAGILSIKALASDGSGDVFTLAQGIVSAVDHGAKVINICLGTYGNSYILQDAVKYAHRHDVAIVAAAGNDAAEGLLYPARYEGVLAVSGVDATERHVYFSNRGMEVDLAAPSLGVNAAGEEDGFSLFTGTSAATPFVSGALAWLLSENTQLSSDDAIALLLSFANDAGAPGKDQEMGDGILNLRRLQERNQPGIYDVAVGNPYVQTLEAGDTECRVTLFAQNRGTEPLSIVTLTGIIADAVRSTTIYNLSVGEVGTLDLQVAVNQIVAGEVSITVSATASGVTDAYPHNNRRTSTLVLKQEEPVTP